MPPDHLRATDEDRDRAAGTLRRACQVGCLTLDELEERLESAYAARTLGELAALQDDLPSPLPVPAGSASPAARGRRPRLRGGRIAFAERVELSIAPAECRTQVLEHIAPLMAADGYTLVLGDAHRLAFETERRPEWTILVAIFGFPFGLFALLIKNRERIDIELSAGRDGGTQLIAAGKAPKRVRRAFAELRD